MATTLQFKRATTTQLAAITGAVGEIIVDLTKDTVTVHDGLTSGGSPLATEAFVANTSTDYASSNFDTDFSSKSTDDLSEGSSNLYFTDVRSRNVLSASGDLAYNSVTGNFSVTTYKDTDVENYLSGGTGVGFTSGVISIGQPVSTSDNVTFNDLVLNGNLTVNGTTTTLNTATLEVEDLNITVASGATDSASANGAGLTIDGANATLLYTSSNDRFVFNKDIEATTLVGQVSDISNHDTNDLSEGDTNLYYTDTRVRNAVSASTGIDYNSTTGDFALADTTVTDGTFGSSSEIPVITIDPQGRITSASTSSVAGVTTFTYDSVTADLEIGTADSSTFTTTIDLDPFNTSDLVEGTTNLYYTDARARNAVSVNGDLSYNSSTGTFSFTERTDAEVRNLISGSTGIDYNSSAGSITLADTTVTAGTFGSASEVPVITVDDQGRITSASTSSVAGVTNFTYNNTSGILDIDTADGSTFSTTVQLGPFTTDDLSEGTTNLYHTDSRVRNAISSSGDLSYDSATGIFSFTERTDQEVRDIFSVSGDLSYDPAVGQFSVTTYKSSDFNTDFSGKSTDNLSEGLSNLYYTDGRVDDHLTGGTGVSFSSGTISIGQPVGTTDDVTFNDLVVNGDIVVNGTTTTLNTAILDVEDINITVASGAIDSAAANGAGLTIDGANATITYASASDRFVFNKDIEATNLVGQVSDISNHDTDDLSEGTTNLYHTDTRTRNALNATGDLSYNSVTGTFSFTERTDAEVRGLLSATGDLSYNDNTGEFSVTTYKSADFDTDFSSKSTSDLTEGTNLYYTDTRARNSVSASGDLNYNSTNGEFSVTTYKSTDFDSDFSGKDTDNLSEGLNLYYTDTRARNAVSASGDISYNLTTGDFSFTERTDAEVRGLLSASGDISYNSATGEFSLTEKTDAEVRGLLSATGDLNYDDTTGVFSVTTYKSTDFDNDFSGKDTDNLSEGSNNLYYTDARVDDHLEGGTGVDYNTGSISIGQSVGTTDNVTFNQVILTSDPTGPNQAAKKSYVDEVAQGLLIRPGVSVLSDSNLSATYDNGTSGVGATLTSTSNGAFPTIDGVTLDTQFDRILIIGQTNTAHNGLYVLTVVGDGSTPWELTRCGTCDESSEIPGSFVFVQDGNTYNATGWVADVNDPSTFVIGTDGIEWIQFSGAGTFSAGSGLELDGTTFSHTDTSTQTSVNNSDGTVIQDITLDTFGHITAIGSKSLDTSDIPESGNLYYTDARTRNALSATGDLVYNSTTGAFSFTERTDSEVRGLLSASGDLSYNNTTGEFSVTTYKSSDFDTDFSGKDTDDLTEGSNLYYTDARSRSALSATGDLSYNSTTGAFSVTTYKSSDFDTDFSGKNTDDLTEGTNLYYTDARANSAIDARVTKTFVDNLNVDADTLDGQNGTFYSDFTNATNKPDPTITLAGDLSGSVTLTDLGDGTLTATVADDSHNHVISNVDNLQDALDAKADDTTTITAGSGLTGGGSLAANRTISHSDTSSQDSVNNSDGTVIQDVTLDGFGHITGLNSANLDGRYLQSYTETDTLDSVTGRGNSTTNDITTTGIVTATDFNSTSDERLKKNVETIENGLDTINKIRPVSFDWKENGEKSFGVIAQEIEQILPQVVATNDEGMKSVAYDKIIAFLIDAVKTLDERTRDK